MDKNFAYEKSGYAVELLHNSMRTYRQWSWRVFDVSLPKLGPLCVCESYSEWTKSDAFNAATKWIDNELNYRPRAARHH